MQKLVSATRSKKVRYAHEAVNVWRVTTGNNKKTYEYIEEARRLFSVAWQTLSKREQRRAKRLTFLLMKSGVREGKYKPESKPRRQRSTFKLFAGSGRGGGSTCSDRELFENRHNKIT